MLFLIECACLLTHVSVQHSSSAVEIQSLQRRVKDNPVIIVVQQRQGDGSIWILSTTVDLHVFHQNGT